MRSLRTPSLTSRIISIAAFAAIAFVAFVSCMGQGTDQIHGMLRVAFPSTAVCQAQSKNIQFRNVSGNEIVISGVTIAGGTDPDGNFKLVSAKVGADETAAVGGILHDIHVPSNTIYSFQVSYTPHTENATHDAIIDIAYTNPKEGVIQVALSGTSTIRTANCQQGGGGSQGGGVGDLNGTLSITITHIALVSSALQLPISTDPDNTATPFVEVTVPLTLDSTANTAVLPAISESVNFELPRTLTPPLSNLITDFTKVTSTGDASGDYGDDGSLTVNAVPIHLQEKFQADFAVTLTTGEALIPNNLPKNLLDQAGFTMNSDRTKVLGSVINPDTKEVILIGIATFSNASGTGTVATTIGGTSGAVVINAVVNIPAP